MSEMTREKVTELTENFLKSGGKIEKITSGDDWKVTIIFDDWLGLEERESKKGKGCHNWTEEHDMRVNTKSFYRLCPYNAFVVENGGVTEDYWTKVIDPLVWSERDVEIAEMREIESNYRWS